MSSDRRERASGSAASRSLQREEGGREDQPIAAPPGWLVEFDQRSEARDVDRLAADGEVLYHLQVAGYSGPTWDQFSDVVGRYGFQVSRAWLSRGVMVQRCRDRGVVRGLPTGADAGPMRFEVADTLAGETVAESLVSFRDKVLKKNKWEPTRGASLKTFFIGHILIRYPDVYGRWKREADRSPWVPIAPHKVPDSPSSCDNPERQLLQRAVIQEAGAELDERTLRVLQLHTAGYSHGEIADELGGSTTGRVVEGILYRHNKRQERKGA